MEVFLSWSKSRSEALAMLLREWLPEVIQQVKPWMSTEDLNKGQRWAVEIGERLDRGSQGVICVTRENMDSPWLNFEAGALAKSLDIGRVRPLLLDMRPSDVTGPLAQFQLTVARERDEMYKLASSLNSECEAPLSESRLRKAFDRAWPDFASELESIPLSEAPHVPKLRRDTDDVLAELLERVREIQRSVITPASGTFSRLSFRSLDAADIRAAWDEVLATVRSMSNRVWAVVREGTVVDVDGDTLVLAFRHSVHADMLEKSPEDLIAALEGVLGGTWQVRAVVSRARVAGVSQVPVTA
jgi:hypothetical protein